MHWVLFEELHRSLPERRLLYKPVYAKPRFAFAHDVHSSVFKTFDLGNPRRYADAVNRVLGFLFGAAAKDHQPERLIAIDTASHHQLVTFFKDVERNEDVGKQDEIGKRKERDFHQII